MSLIRAHTILIVVDPVDVTANFLILGFAVVTILIIFPIWPATSSKQPKVENPWVLVPSFFLNPYLAIMLIETHGSWRLLMVPIIAIAQTCTYLVFWKRNRDRC